MHQRLLQVERGLPVGLLGLADCERGPGAPLHELPFGRHGHALAGRALDIVVALGRLERQVSEVMVVVGVVVAVHGVRVAVLGGCRDMTLGVRYVLSLSRLSSELQKPPERCRLRSLLLLRLLPCLEDWWP